MKTITLQVLDCDQVIVDELKDAYQRNNQSDSYGEGLHHTVIEPEYELLKAIQTVLAYYMTYQDHKEWMEMNPMVKEDD